MAPRNSKVWNGDLVTALRARESVARQAGKRNQLTLGEGAGVIEAVRADIYMFSSGRIVGLPTKKLSKTVNDLCRKIIAGNEPILPPGYAPSSVHERNLDGADRTNPFENDPYVTKIKLRGGAFAILMAFYCCRDSRQTMTKQQLCQAAQPFCDDAMEENYHAGRPYGAWKGIDTLIRHNFVHRQNAQRAYSERAGGIRSMGRDSFSLTREGELFIEQLFKVRPQAKEQLAQHTTRKSNASIPSMISNTPAYRDTSTISLGSASPSHVGSDRETLKAWLSTANPGDSTKFNVGKDRRKHLHRFCDELNQIELASRGMRLEHFSNGESRGRELTIQLVHMPSFDHFERSLTPQSKTNKSHHLVTRSPPPDRVIPFSGSGHSLARQSSSSKGALLPPAEAAAEAAMRRVALFENKIPHKRKEKRVKTKQVDSSQIIIDIADSDDDCGVEAKNFLDNSRSSQQSNHQMLKMTKFSGVGNIVDLTASDEPSTSNKQKATARKLAFDNKVLEILDSDDEDEDLLSGGLMFGRKRNLKAQSETANVQPTDQIQMIIKIDNRERNRNRTPRLLRTELERLISSGPCASTWPSFLTKPMVEESTLSHGDFNFVHKEACDHEKSSTLPVMIERKRIGDLVQRSATRDHWGQLQSMLSLSCQPISVFLLEGDFRTANSYVAFGAGDDWRKNDHTIDDELSLLRFVGRAILTSGNVRFAQTKDEQDSLRAVIAMGLISSTTYHNSKPPPRSAAGNPYKRAKTGHGMLLKDCLEQGGIPWQVARTLSQEVGSSSRLKALYECADSEESRSQLLVPLIEDACKDIAESKASAKSWSHAIYAVFSSRAVDLEHIRHAFAEYKNFVTDDAFLLGKCLVMWNSVNNFGFNN